MATAVLCAPLFDDVTKYSHAWSREIKEWLEAEGYSVVDIGGNRVGRKEVERALKENPGALYLFYNHGSYEALWGSHSEAVTDIFNADLLSGRTVYTMACQSAKTLGYEAWRRNCNFYWGYDEVFSFTTDSLEEFKRLANCGIKFWLETKSWKEALERAKELGRKLVDKLIEAGKLLASSCMDWNISHLHVWDVEEPPKPCRFRLLAVRILGPKAYLVRRAFAYGLMIAIFGYGVTWCDAAHHVWVLKGTHFSLEGVYLGLFALGVGLIMLVREYSKSLSLRERISKILRG